MPEIAFAFAVVTSVVFGALCVPFLKAVKREAPALFEAWGSPSAWDYFWHRQLLMPRSGTLLRREYPAVLARYPRSRAWASWLYVAHWLQMIAAAMFAIAFVQIQ
jgi:hypothetical protein